MSSSFDASIPVLTEILYVADNPEIEGQGAPEVKEEPKIERQARIDDHAVIEAAAPGSQASDEQAWNVLEQQLSERIMRQLQQQMPAVLEQQMNEMLQGLSQKICADLQANVARIVAQELVQMKTEISKP
jgi:hypothetical protein